MPHHSIPGMPWPKPGGHHHVVGLRRVGSKSDIFITFFHILLEATRKFVVVVAYSAVVTK